MREVPDPRVSVLIPCHDAAAWIEACVASARDQARDYPDVEIVLVDDASTDATPDIVSRLCASDGVPVRAFRVEHRNSCASRNLAMRHASGAMLLHLDADDLLLPGAIRALVDEWRRSEADIVIGGWRNFDDETPPDLAPAVDADVRYDDVIASLVSRVPVISAGIFPAGTGDWDESLQINTGMTYVLSRLAEEVTVSRIARPVTAIRQHDSPWRMSVAEDHWDAARLASLYRRFRDRFEGNGRLTFERRAAFDSHVLWHAYRLVAVREVDQARRIVAGLDVSGIAGYPGYQRFGLGGYVHRLGVIPGLLAFAFVNRLLGRLP